MKPKTIVILLVVLVALGGIVFFRQNQNKPPVITEQVQLEALVPADLEDDALARIEVYAGAKPDEKVTLVRGEDGESWRVASHFNAPVQDSKITAFIKSLSGLKGEFRAASTGDELAAYDLTDEKGFHVVGYQKDSDAPAFHVITGKAPKFNEIFARTADGDQVFVVTENLRQTAGVYAEETDAVPTADTWLDKQMAALDREAVNRVELNYPDKTIVLVKQEKPQPEQPAAESEATEEDAETTDTPEEPKDIPEESKDVPEETKPVEYEWIAEQGGVGQMPKETGINSLLNKLANLSGTEIVDPAKAAEWGLETPAYIARIYLADQETPVIVQAGRVEGDDNAYLRLAESDNNLVYKINKYGFEQLFPKGNMLFDLPSLALNAADIQHVEYALGETSVVLDKVESDWQVKQPAAPLPTVPSKLQGIAAGLATWRAEDYAEPGKVDAGLDSPNRTVTFTTASGESHTVALGAPSEHIDGFYAKFDNNDRILATTEIDANKVFVEPKDLFNRDVFAFDEETVTSIQITRENEADSFELRRVEDQWQLVQGEQTTPAVQDAVDDFLFALAELEAVDLAFADARVMGGFFASVLVTTDDGTPHELVIEIEADGQHPATKPATPGVVFYLANTDATGILPAPAALLPAPEPEAEAQPTADAAVEVQEATDAPEPQSFEPSPAPEPSPDASTATPEP